VFCYIRGHQCLWQTVYLTAIVCSLLLDVFSDHYLVSTGFLQSFRECVMVGGCPALVRICDNSQ
jgi:hypothetical protein